ncbi:MAG: pre-peptidase C-terminal domain-containing protein, partial [Planctomycetales bacterium]|nr:pre-peptidase C-terminal domain-containing protein [Planctomycetales bacterium]
TGDGDNAGATGAYSLILTPVGGDSDPDDQLSQAMALGSMTQTRTRTGESISVDTDVDLYSFTVTAGQLITFDIDGDLDSVIELFDSDGTFLDGNDQGAAPDEADGDESFLDYTFTSGGTFYLGVSGYQNEDYDPITGDGDNAGATGAYSLILTPVGGDSDPDDQLTEAIALGSLTETRTRTGESVSVDTDVDLYSFTVTAGQRITFDIDGDLDSVIELFDSNGAFLNGNDQGAAPDESASDQSYLDYTFTSGGTFYLGVSGYQNEDYDPITGDGDNAGATGAYSLILTPVPRSVTTLSVAATDANKAEGNSGSTPFTFTVTRGGDTSAATTVDYSVSAEGLLIYRCLDCPNTFAEETDFSGGAVPSGTVSFSAGETTKVITINVKGDTDWELDEGFVLVLSNRTGGATITTDRATGTIQDDDTPILLNTAPVLNNSGTPYLIAPAGSRLPVDMSNGILISDLLARGAGGNPITDADLGALEGIAWTGINKIEGSYGRWEYTLAANPQASNWINVETAGTISNSSALLLPANARLRFVTTLIPYHGSNAAAGHLATETKLDTGLTFRAWDQTAGTAGERADTSINGGSTAFSTATETAGTYFETRLWRTYNASAQLNTYSLELEATILINTFGYQDRSTSDYSGFTILMSPIPGVSTAPLYRMYFGTSYSTDGITQTDMGYRYLTTNLSEAIILEGIGPAAHRAERDGTYFRELGVNNGTGITGYIYTTAQPGMSEMSQTYRTDPFRKNTRTGPVGSPTTGTVMQQQGDHVYTTKSAFEMSKPGTWRQESSRGFVRELSPNVGGVAAPARSAAAQTFSIGDQLSASTISADIAEFPRRLMGLLEQSGLQLPLSGPTNAVFAAAVEATASSESPKTDPFDSLTDQNDEEQSSSSELVWSAFGRQFSDFFTSCP